MSNKVLAACIEFWDKTQLIGINARLKCDPEVLAHALIEEFAHANQRIEGVNFEEERRQFAYDERPYEIEAKRIATSALSYAPEDYETVVKRDEPDGILYDKPIP